MLKMWPLDDKGVTPKEPGRNLACQPGITPVYNVKEPKHVWRESTWTR
jgi:hypothetical protein